MTLLISGNRSLGQRGFRFGVVDGIVNSRLSPTLLSRASYLTAAATGADSFWVGDHLNAFLPRSIATTEYFGAAVKLVPKVDAVLEPWTMLGHLAARNRVRRLRLGVWSPTPVAAIPRSRRRPPRLCICLPGAAPSSVSVSANAKATNPAVMKWYLERAGLWPVPCGFEVAVRLAAAALTGC
jgi:hypothetical protein